MSGPQRDAPVLVADDLPEMRDLLRTALEALRPDSGRPVRILLAANGREAVEQARQQPLALALLDLRMPLLDGIEAARSIRRVQPRCPILLYSAFAHAELERRARAAGVSAYLEKPFRVDGLLRMVEEWIES